VLNKASQLSGLSIDDIAAALGSRRITQVPTGGQELTQAINEGKPVVLHQAKSSVGRALHGLAEQVRAGITPVTSRR
jgi:septum formation inhibitor-activating ATPase MinD